MNIERASQNPNDPLTINNQKYYAPNWKDIVVKLDGDRLKQENLVRADAVEGFVDAFVRNDDGTIKMSQATKPMERRVYGEVTIEGSISGCSSCSRNARRQRRWWI